MTGPLMRIAAGAGAFIVIATVGGSGIAVSAADPGGSSQTSHSRHDGRSDARGGQHRGHGAHNDDRRGTPHSGGRGGRGGRDRRGASASQGSSTPTVAGRTGSAIAAAAPATATMSSSPVPVTVEQGGSATPVDVDRAPHVAPRVTVGNGRSPVVPSSGPDEVPTQVIPSSAIVLPPSVAPAPALAPTPVPLPVLRLEAPRSEMPAASYWGTLNPGWPAGALFGIAGLILAPIAGVWLGHRQARAAKAAARLVRS